MPVLVTHSFAAFCTGLRWALGACQCAPTGKQIAGFRMGGSMVWCATPVLRAGGEWTKVDRRTEAQIGKIVKGEQANPVVRYLANVCKAFGQACGQLAGEG